METCSGSPSREQEGRVWQYAKPNTCKIYPRLGLEIDILMHFSLFSQISQNFHNPTGSFLVDLLIKSVLISFITVWLWNNFPFTSYIFLPGKYKYWLSLIFFPIFFYFRITFFLSHNEPVLSKENVKSSSNAHNLNWFSREFYNKHWWRFLMIYSVHS